MYKLAGRKKLGRKASHRRALVQNQVRSLLLNGNIVTTTPKAKVLKANAQSLSARLGKIKDVNARKLEVRQFVNEDAIVEKLVNYFGESPKVSIVRVGYRDGDNAQLSRVKFEGLDLKSRKSPPAKPAKVAEAAKKEVSKSDAQDVDGKDSKDIKAEAMEARQTERNKGIAKSLKDKIVKKERTRTRSGL